MFILYILIEFCVVKQSLNIHLKYFCNLVKGLQIRLRGICAPFAHRASRLIKSVQLTISQICLAQQELLLFDLDLPLFPIY